MRALEWSQHYHAQGDDGILKKYKLIQAFIVVLLICKNEEDQIQKRKH